ncbi:9914_t:CDS:10 [Paraglomus occultum]|uniref:9914_t:CDS:1 n=1 Tax=Paraglomus occultum TaxID=144539 RepID=A0A9N8WJK4_9GLOM|nr:9914_t:CDS:10 [Paraglomus occultum]
MSDAEFANVESNDAADKDAHATTASEIGYLDMSKDVSKERHSDDAIVDRKEDIIPSRPRIRYTQEQLLALSHSPLVKRPDALPPVNSWFGEHIKRDNKKLTGDGIEGDNKSKTYGEGSSKLKDDVIGLGIPKSPASSVSKSPNGSAPTSPRPAVQEKIVLGPPKMNFASTSLVGLKASGEKLSTRSNRTDGSRRQTDDLIYTKPSNKEFEPRAPRGPTGGRGFVGREALRERNLAEKASKEVNTFSSNTNGRLTAGARPHETTRVGMGHKDKTSNSRHHNYQEERSETPEWMNYNPQTDETMKKGKKNDDDNKAFIDDIQAWKQKMREQEKHKQRVEKDRKDPNERSRPRSMSRADSSVSWRADSKLVAIEGHMTATVGTSNDKENIIKEDTTFDIDVKPSKSTSNVPNVDRLFGLGGLDINAPLDPNSSAFDNFLSQHRLAIAEENVGKTNNVKELEGPSREQETSRFARFFSHSTDKGTSNMDNVDESKTNSMPTQATSTSNDVPKSGASIKFETLFQNQTTTNHSTPLSPRTTTNDGKRMLSEAEVLQRLGARPSSKSHDFDDTSVDDVMGFKKILAALEKGNNAMESPSNFSVPPSVHALPAYQSGLAHQGLPFNDPSIIIAQKPVMGNKPPKLETSNRGMIIPDANPSDSVKKINNMLLGGNVPTSVYRQLSSRSDNGSRESSGASSPALKFNAAKPLVSSFSRSPIIPQSPTISDFHGSDFKAAGPPRSPGLPQGNFNPSPYHGIHPPYSNGPNMSLGRDYPQPSPQPPPPPQLGRNIPVEQLFNLAPPRNPQQLQSQFQQASIPVSLHPPFGPAIPQQFAVPSQPNILHPGAEALFANMHGYTHFIPNIVNSTLGPNSLSGMPSNTGLQQRSMMTLEEIERRGLGGR